MLHRQPISDLRFQPAWTSVYHWLKDLIMAGRAPHWFFVVAFLVWQGAPGWAESYQFPPWREARFSQVVTNRATITVESASSQKLPILKLMIPVRPALPDQIQLELPIRHGLGAGRWQVGLNFRVSAGSALPVGLELDSENGQRLNRSDIVADKTWQTATLMVDLMEAQESVTLVVVPGASIQTLEFGDASITLLDKVAMPGPVGTAGGSAPAAGDITLMPRQATMHGSLRVETKGTTDDIGYWNNQRDYAEWKTTLGRGTYELILRTSSDKDPSDLEIACGDASVTSKIKGTGSWDSFVSTTVGRLTIPASGETSIVARPDPHGTWKTLNLASLILRPVGSVGSGDGAGIVLVPKQANLHGGLKLETNGGMDDIGWFFGMKDWVEWTTDIPRSGNYEVSISVSTPNVGADLQVEIGDQVLLGHIAKTGDWINFKPVVLGTMRLGQAGNTTVNVRPDPKGTWNAINIANVTLRPMP